MRTLAIDLGTRRVGLALSDAGATLATPLEVLEISSPENAIHQISQIVSREGVQRLLVGVPLDMDDQIGNSARSAIIWARALADHCRLPLVYVDERLSSFIAEQSLDRRKQSGERLTRKRRRQQLDAIVAANLLQEFLDGKLPALEKLD